MRPRSCCLAGALLSAVAGCGGTRTPESTGRQPAPSGGTVEAITAADLKARISIFADDSMLGRRAGTLGNVRGNAYIASELTRLGLKPAGDSGSFLQRVPLTSYALDSARGILHTASGSLTPFADYFPYTPTYAVPTRPINGSPLVYIGRLDDSASHPSRDALKGKVVLFRSSATGNSLGAPDLSSRGRLGLIARIAMTEIDPLIAKFADYFHAPKLELKDAMAAPAGVTIPRMLFIPTGSVDMLFGKPLDSLRPGDTASALKGEVVYT